jgi:hypothetical protein
MSLNKRILSAPLGAVRMVFDGSVRSCSILED